MFFNKLNGHLQSVNERLESATIHQHVLQRVSRKVASTLCRWPVSAVIVFIGAAKQLSHSFIT